VKIIFLVPYPEDTAPSQRFRFEQYLFFLKEKGILYEIHPFIDLHTWILLYSKGGYLKKIMGLSRGFLRRILLLRKIKKFNWVFIHREASPIGPPIFEWIIAKVFRKRIIFDFDDAIWLPNTTAENKAVSILKFHKKTALICKWSNKVSAGNDYLAGYARRYNQNVVVNPSTIDTVYTHNRLKEQYTDETIIGWTGSHSTLKYLEVIIPVLKKLENVYHFTFLVIADKDPMLPLKSFRFKKWDKQSEIEDLLQINIGIMPLFDDMWSKGKCGFKALQYMSLGIPVVASPVGVNKKIIAHERSGFLCSTESDWHDKLRLLMKDPDLRFLMGKNGRVKVEQYYSVNSNKENFLKLFGIK
jgi:glycosyltransferase involved in cell wall biosynthesis